MKKLLLGIIAVVLLSFGLNTFATNTWTSFWKLGNPITLPKFEVLQGGSTSGAYTVGGTLLFQVGSGNVVQTFLPFLDASGDAFITTNTMPALNYVPLSDSGVYFNLFSGDYFNTNIIGYITGFTETDPIWNGVSGDYLKLDQSDEQIITNGMPIFDIGIAFGVSGTSIGYDNQFAMQLFDSHFTGGVFLEDFYLANNPDGYITGFTEVDPDFNAHSGDYLTGFIESDPDFNAHSGDYLTGFIESDPEWNSVSGNYLTGFSELDPVRSAASGNYLLSSNISGTTNYIPLFTASNAIGNSTITQGTIGNITAGGFSNSNVGYASFIGGGNSNTIGTSLQASAIIGGKGNTVNNSIYRSAIIAGENNSINSYLGNEAYFNTIIGGYANTMNGGAEKSTIIGGESNVISGVQTFAYALGKQAIANTSNTFVYNNTGTYVASIPGSFNVNTYGGIYLNGAVSCKGTITTTAYILTGGIIPMQIIASGTDMSFQMYSGGVRVEKGKFSR